MATNPQQLTAGLVLLRADVQRLDARLVSLAEVMRRLLGIENSP